MIRYVRLSDLLDGAPVPERDVEAAEREPEPSEASSAPSSGRRVPRSRVAVVERAAQQIAAFEAHPGGEEFPGASAADVIDDELGPCRSWRDLMRWARLARAAYRRASERRR